MKKIIMILLLVAQLIFVVGCQENTEDSFALTLNGDSTIYLDIGEKYTELGVLYDASYNVAISINGMVDSNNPGTYYIIYSTDYDGKHYSIVRKVIVLDDGSNLEEHDFDFAMMITDVMFSTVSFYIDISDNERLLGNNPTVYIKKDGKVIDSSSFSDGYTEIDFNNLNADTSYDLVISEEYMEHNVTKTFEESISFSTLTDDIPYIFLTSSQSDDTSLSCVIDVFQYNLFLTTPVLKIYLEDELINQFNLHNGSNQIEQDELESGELYFLEVSYSYQDPINSLEIEKEEELGIIMIYERIEIDR